MLQREIGLFDADFICIQGADRVTSFWEYELPGRRYKTWWVERSPCRPPLPLTPLPPFRWVKRSPYRSESIGIAWRSERFKEIKRKTWNLNDILPPGGFYPHDSVAQAIMMNDCAGGGRQFILVNCYLCQEDDEERVRVDQVKHIREWLIEQRKLWSLPVVWVGDFGTTPGSETHTTLLTGEAQSPSTGHNATEQEAGAQETGEEAQAEGGARGDRPSTAHPSTAGPGRGEGYAAGGRGQRPGTAKVVKGGRSPDRSPSPARGYGGHPPNSVQRRLLAQRSIGKQQDTSVAMEKPGVHDGDPLEGLLFLDVHASDYMLPPRCTRLPKKGEGRVQDFILHSAGSVVSTSRWQLPEIQEIESDGKNWAGCLPNRARWSPSDHLPLLATVAIVSNSNVYQHVGSQVALRSTATAIEVDQRRHLTIWEKENKKLATEIQMGKADRPSSAYSYSGQSQRPRSAFPSGASLALEASVWDPSEVEYEYMEGDACGVEGEHTEEEANPSVWRDISAELQGPGSAMDVKTGVWSKQWNPYAAPGPVEKEAEKEAAAAAAAAAVSPNRPQTAGSMRVNLDGKGLRDKV